MAAPARPLELPASVRLLLQKQIESPDFQLPLLPSTAAEVMAMCRQDSCNAVGLAQLLQRDPTLAANVLRMSNSAGYAPQEPIVSLQQAISRLGLSTICEIVTSIAMRGRVFDIKGYEPQVQRIWKHSVVTAVYAREVARTVRHNVEGAYMCGLLHDVGKPLVLQALISVARQRTERSIPASILESAMSEFHTALGARLAHSWALSEWVAEAAAHHHDYRKAQLFPKEAMITHLADLLAHWALDRTLDESSFPAEDPVVEELGLYGDDLALLFQQRSAVIQLAQVFA